MRIRAALPGQFGSPGYRLLMGLIRHTSPQDINWTPADSQDIENQLAAVYALMQRRQRMLGHADEEAPRITIFVDESARYLPGRTARFATNWTFSLAEALYVSTMCVLPGYTPDPALPGFADLDEDTTTVWRLLRIGEITARDIADVHQVLHRYARLASRH